MNVADGNKDIEFTTDYKDRYVEEQLLYEYYVFTQKGYKQADNPEEASFFKKLCKEVQRDLMKVPGWAVWAAATSWERMAKLG